MNESCCEISKEQKKLMQIAEEIIKIFKKNELSQNQAMEALMHVKADLGEQKV